MTINIDRHLRNQETSFKDALTTLVSIPSVCDESSSHLPFGTAIDDALHKAINQTLQRSYPGIALESLSPGKWKVVIPKRYHVGHEAHFAQVTEKYLRYLAEGKLPRWEVPNMLAKYYTTTEAMKKAKQAE